MVVSNRMTAKGALHPPNGHRQYVWLPVVQNEEIVEDMDYKGHLEGFQNPMHIIDELNGGVSKKQPTRECQPVEHKGVKGELNEMRCATWAHQQLQSQPISGIIVIKPIRLERHDTV